MPPLEPVHGDAADHLTACYHPLRSGEDLHPTREDGAA
jgi:hypothetical protein